MVDIEEPTNTSERCTARILDMLTDRKWFRREWQDLDEEIQQQIIEDCVKIIEREIEMAYGSTIVFGDEPK